MYSFLNHKNTIDLSWKGWDKIWKLKVAPRVQFVTWLTRHGRNKSFQFCMRLFWALLKYVFFVGFVMRILAIFLVLVAKLKRVWREVGYRLGKNIFFPEASA